MDRPTIFLSSTIFDFRDLRSALKDFLELRGCRVLASEFNDFSKPLDIHSYEACLETIAQADFFVLFIGSRVGGLLDAKSGISITRGEYRRAYELAQAGRIRLLTFVRSDVWTYRESVKELARSLEAEAVLSEEQKAAVAGRRSRFMTDGTTINAFIDEVARNRETAAAARGEGEMPIGNWIHQFSTFAEVRQVVEPLINHGLTVKAAAGRKALQAHLLTLLQTLLSSSPSGLYLPEAAVRTLARELDLKAEAFNEAIRMSSKNWTRLVVLTSSVARSRLDLAPLQAVLTSDLLLQYDPATGRFVATAEYDMLVRLLENARILQSPLAGAGSDLFKYGQRVDASEARSVPAHILASHLHDLFRWVEVANCARVLALSLEGLPLVSPPPMPRSPFLDQEAKLAAEEISLAQVRAFLGLGEVRDPGLDP